MKTLKGSGVALITPFNDDLSVDYTSLARLVEHNINGEISYLVVMGTTAENGVLSKEEKQQILSLVVEQTAGRVPIVFGIGSNCTQSVIDDMKSYNLSGVSAILSVTPYYNKPNQEGLYAHFAAIANESTLPIILYNVPGRTGVNMSAETTLRLARDFKNIVAVKEASGNLNQISYIIKDRPKGFLVISGDDNLTIPIMSIGGEGVISVSANAIPYEVSEIVRLCEAGDYLSAQKLLMTILEFQDLIFAEGNPVGVKAACEIKGLIKNNLRLPLVKSSESLYTKMEAILK